MKKILFLSFGSLLAAPALAASLCGEIYTSHYGPYDYRDRGSGKLEVVEKAHFPEQVEAGIKGSTSYLGGDLDYTLMAIPNHVRALNTIAMVALREKAVRLQGARFPVECYFERAIRFAPDDGAVRAVYANYLSRLGRKDEARVMYAAGVELKPNDPTINYNAGLAYAKNKEYDKARQFARKAYGMGFPLPGLKNMLLGAGQWSAEDELKVAQSMAGEAKDGEAAAPAGEPKPGQAD